MSSTFKKNKPIVLKIWNKTWRVGYIRLPSLQLYTCLWISLCWWYLCFPPHRNYCTVYWHYALFFLFISLYIELCKKEKTSILSVSAYTLDLIASVTANSECQVIICALPFDTWQRSPKTNASPRAAENKLNKRILNFSNFQMREITLCGFHCCNITRSVYRPSNQ